VGEAIGVGRLPVNGARIITRGALVLSFAQADKRDVCEAFPPGLHPGGTATGIRAFIGLAFLLLACQPALRHRGHPFATIIALPPRKPW